MSTTKPFKSKKSASLTSKIEAIKRGTCLVLTTAQEGRVASGLIQQVTAKTGVKYATEVSDNGRDVHIFIKD